MQLVGVMPSGPMAWLSMMLICSNHIELVCCPSPQWTPIGHIATYCNSLRGVSGNGERCAEMYYDPPAFDCIWLNALFTVSH